MIQNPNAQSVKVLLYGIIDISTRYNLLIFTLEKYIKIHLLDNENTTCSKIPTQQ